MITITNEQLKKILEPAIYNWDTAFKNYDFIKMELGTSEDKKMLKISLKSKLLENYNENHFFEDYEEILKTIEEVLLFPAYEKTSDSKFHEEIFRELDKTFSFLGRKCTTYDDYLSKKSKDAYIKIEIHELLKLLKRLTGQLVPEDLVGKIKQEASRREGYKLAVHFTKWASSEQDDRIIFTVLPNIFSRILTAHEHQDFIEEILLEQSYKCNVIEKEELFERIDDLNRVFKVKKDKKYFENKFDLISENFLVCPNKYFLTPLKLPKVFPAMYGRAHGEPKVEKFTFKPDFSFIWNQKPFDLKGLKIDKTNWWKTEENEPDNVLALKYAFWDEFTKEEIAKAKGDKNNMNTNKNKPMRPDSIMFDEENKITVAFLGGEKFIIKCNEGDKFDYRIAIGVACSRVNCNNTELVYLREHMNWKEYYMYCYNKFFYFDPVRIKAFENAVYAEKEQYKLKLDEEKVRKYRCEEVEFNVYKPKKITHDFILFNPQGE